MYRSTRSGDGNEFDEIRAFRPGDRIGFIVATSLTVVALIALGRSEPSTEESRPDRRNDRDPIA